MGKHQLTGATVCGDPIMWFLFRRILNPSAFVLGRPGLGKSTLVRRIVNVSAAFGIIPLILSDLKPDYPDLVRALGGQVIEVGPERGHVNPLDPGPLALELHRLPPDTRRRVEAEQLGAGVERAHRVVRAGPRRSADRPGRVHAVRGPARGLHAAHGTADRRRGGDHRRPPPPGAGHVAGPGGTPATTTPPRTCWPR